MRVLKKLGVALWLGAVSATSPQAAELVGLAPHVAAASGQQADAATGAYAQGFAAPAGAVLEAIRWWGFHGANSEGPAFDNLLVLLDGVPQQGALSVVVVSGMYEYTLDIDDAPLLASSLSLLNDSLDVEWFWQSAAAPGGLPDAQNVAFSLLGRIDRTEVPEPTSAALLLAGLAVMLGARRARMGSSRCGQLAASSFTCRSRVSASLTSNLPGTSMFSVFTTPSSTSIE